MHLKPKKGFTLIEMLIVLAIIAMLVSIVIVAINPGRHFAQARNTQRWTGVNAILNAVHQNIIDNKGNFTCLPPPPQIPPVPSPTPPGQQILEYPRRIASKGPDECNICYCLVSTYLRSLPYDPSSGSYTACNNYDTGYEISQDPTTLHITVSAPHAELNETISVTR